MSGLLRLGLLKERKLPVERRVPLTPQQCLLLKDRFNVDVVVESSDCRCFSDNEYEAAGVPVVSDLSDCDIILGVKEPSVDHMLANKFYCLFSHTTKMQPHSSKLLQGVLKKKVRLLDFECLRNSSGDRIIGFGRYAGLVGAYYGLRAYACRVFDAEMPVRPNSVDCLKRELKTLMQLAGWKSAPIRILLTGKGRVGNGARELLLLAGFTECFDVDAFLYTKPQTSTFINIDCDSYVKRKNGGGFSFPHFFSHPSEYEGDFARFLPAMDLLINGSFWNPNSPVLFSGDDISRLKSCFKPKVIADISCDINGPLPTTIRATSFDVPFYDLSFTNSQEVEPFKGDVTVMSIDNLPCAIAVDSSHSFGDQLLNYVFPELLSLSYPQGGVIDNATIAADGKLNKPYSYLSRFANFDP